MFAVYGQFLLKWEWNGSPVMLTVARGQTVCLAEAKQQKHQNKLFKEKGEGTCSHFA